MSKYFCLKDGVIEESDFYPSSYGIGFLGYAEVADCDFLDKTVIDRILESKYTSYERGENYQSVLLNSPNTVEMSEQYGRILIFCNMRGVVVVCRDDGLAGIVGDFNDKIFPDIPHFIAGLLWGITAHDYIFMEGVEKELGKLESSIISYHTPNCGQKINGYRRRVAVIKRYYEQLFEVCDTLCEEEWLSSAVSEFQKLKEKVQRLREDSMYLRDYMSQVREAYQQAIDLSLNSVMKFLTTVTVLFCPLTFLVGWYGMNFNMPETELSFGYVIPIILSISMIGVSIFIFKKRKWF